MNVLFQFKDDSFDREIREFTKEQGNVTFITHTTEESIQVLSSSEIHKAVVSLKIINDTAILKFINDYYPHIEVVVIANKTFDDVISILTNSNYSVLHEPLRLSELKGQTGTNSLQSKNTKIKHTNNK